MFGIRSEAKKELLKEKLENKTNNLLANVEELLDNVRKDIEDIARLKYNIDNIKLSINEELDIVLWAICTTNNFYIKNPIGAIANDFSGYGKPYIADSYIILPVKYISGGDKEFFAFIPRKGLETIVVENIMEDELEMDIEAQCMSSMIFSDDPKVSIAGVLMSSASRTIAEYVKYDDIKKGDYYIHFNIDYFGYNVILKSEDLKFGNLWLDIEKDGNKVTVGPLRPDLDYIEVFDNDILEPSLLDKLFSKDKK